jgi:hypothetical protein
MKAALVTPCLPHLPLHPSCFLGYGAAILAGRYDLEVLDLNAELQFTNQAKLKPILQFMDESRVVSDAHLTPFYEGVEAQIDSHYSAVPWERFSLVYVTPPSWFPMVPAQAVIRLSRAVEAVSPETMVLFFGNSLGSWTDEEELKKHGIRIAHLNDLFSLKGTSEPVNYDLLPHPIYAHREKYLFDLLPFTLKHGCAWGRCRFCSLSRGWNSMYLERSARAAAKELEVLMDGYDPRALVCRDHSVHGRNLTEFCSSVERWKKPWCAQSRADLSEKKIKALWRAGCRAIYFGLESGSDRVLSAIDKGITSRQMSNFIRRLHSNGILPVPSLVVGAPGEGTADFDQTIGFLVNHRPYLDAVNVYPFMPTPASEFTSRKSGPIRIRP